MCAAQTASDEYEALINDIISTAVDTMGQDQALSLASDVDAIALSNGTVDRTRGDPVAAAEATAPVYIDQLGMASQVALQSVAREYEDSSEIPEHIS